MFLMVLAVAFIHSGIHYKHVATQLRYVICELRKCLNILTQDSRYYLTVVSMKFYRKEFRFKGGDSATQLMDPLFARVCPKLLRFNNDESIYIIQRRTVKEKAE